MEERGEINKMNEYGDLDDVDLALQEMVRQGRLTVSVDDEGRKVYTLVRN